MKSFKGLVWSSFLKTYGPVTGLLGIILAILFAFVPDLGNFDVPLWWPLLVFFVSLILITTFLDASYKGYLSSKKTLPKVISAKNFPNNDTNIIVQCLLEPSEIFSHDSLVSFYFVEEDNFEVLIGIGYVINIQEDKRIQVVMNQCVEVHKEIIEKLIDNNATIIKKTIIKPNIPKTQLEYYIG